MKNNIVKIIYTVDCVTVGVGVRFRIIFKARFRFIFKARFRVIFKARFKVMYNTIIMVRFWTRFLF